MLKQDAMLDALRKKKGQGLDLTIILGDDMGMQEEENGEKLGLAPDTKEQTLQEGDDKVLAQELEDGDAVPTTEEVVDPMHADEEQDKNLVRKILEDAEAEGQLGKKLLAQRKK